MKDDPEIYAVILAGGSGTRFWPKSRLKEPKQLCKIGSTDKTMIEITLDRLDGFIPAENRIIVTHHKQIDATMKLVQSKAGHFIAEPEAKNTAAALALGAFAVKSISSSKNPIMMSFHADHLIQDNEKFIDTLKQAQRAAEQGKLTLVGINPDFPETGFGYIECGSSFLEPEIFEVTSFKEKPDLEIAEKYLNSGNYLWNSGLFIWKVETFLNELREYLPNTILEFEKCEEGFGVPLNQLNWQQLAPMYSKLQNVAVDNAVLECSDKTVVVKGCFSWKDVGSWGALSDCFETDSRGNIQLGRGKLFDCSGCVVDSDGVYIAALGLNDIVIVSSKEAILVCPKSKSQEVKKIVESLKESNDQTLI